MATTDNSTIQPLAVNDPLCSSDSVWYKDNEFLSVSDKFDEVEAAIANKANSSHTHTEYAASSHTHDGYATQTALDTLESELDDGSETWHFNCGTSTTVLD